MSCVMALVDASIAIYNCAAALGKICYISGWTENGCFEVKPSVYCSYEGSMFHWKICVADCFPISSFGVDKGHCNMFTTLQNELFSYSVVVWWLYGRLFLSSIDLVHFVLVYLRGVSGLGCKIARCSLFFEPVVREKCKIFWGEISL